MCSTFRPRRAVTLADLPAVAALPADQKRALMEELRDAIAVEEGPGPLTPEQLEELNRRRAAFEADPSIGLTFDQVKAECAAWKAARGA